MFVRGEIEDKERVLIDIGTGYYLEKVKYTIHAALVVYSLHLFEIID